MVDPKARADDLRWALENDEIKAIFSTIGGDESVRILPYIDLDLIGKHPKVMWRRGELNPRPKMFKNWPLHAYSAISSSPSGRPRTGCRKASRFNFGRPSNRRTMAT
jgi:LD-carboxypeptidase N-terminal domain